MSNIPPQRVSRDNGLGTDQADPRCEVSVREAVAGDLGFIDQLQKVHGHMVGFLPYKQIEKKIADGHVVVAEDRRGEGRASAFETFTGRLTAARPSGPRRTR